MADVTGQFGDQEVVLNNAATEATLKQLVGVMSAMAKKAGVEIQSDKELDASLKRLGKQTEAGVRSGRKFQRSQDKLGKSADGASDSLDDAAESADTFGAAIKDNLQFIGKLGQTAQKAIDYIGGTLSSIANMGDSITSATDTLGNVPLIGDAIKGVYGPVAGAVEQLQTQFQSAASVGANFGGNIAEFSRAAGNAGMTMEQFSGVVQKNAQNLVFLGGSTADGAKRLADMGKQIRKSQIGDELARLGYSTTDINNGLAEYSGRLARSGRAEQLSNKQLINLTGQYMKNLDAVSKLTGKSKEALQAEQDARMADAQYRIMRSKLDPKQQAEMDKLMDSIPKAHQTGIKEILATGTATSKEGVKAMAFLKESGGAAQEIFKKIQSGQGLEEGFASDFYDTYAAEAKKFAESPVGETLGKFDESMNDFYVAAADVAERNKTLAEIQKEIEDNLKKNREDAAKGVGDIIDPAAIKTFKENIAQASTEFTTALGSIDLKPLESVFTQALDAAKDYLVPALKKAAENFPAFLTAMGAANAALKALELAAGAAAAAQLLGIGGKGGKGGGGAAGGGSKKNAPKPKPGAGAAKGILRRFGPLGLAYGLYEGFTSYNEVDESLEAGEITENQAKVQKSEVVGETTGGTAGAMAGAAAGALAGSVVPVIGTAIGGLIGGALGYWGGSAAGKALGSEIGETLVGPDTIKDVEDKIAALNAAIAEDSWSSVGFSADDEKEELAQLQKDLIALKAKKAEQEKQIRESQGIPKDPDTPNPGEVTTGSEEKPNTTASDAQKTLEQQAAEEKAKAAKEEQKRLEEEKKKQEALEGVPVSESSQKTPDQLLSELNSSMNQLVQLATTQTMLAKKQLGVTGENVGDLYGAV